MKIAARRPLALVAVLLSALSLACDGSTPAKATFQVVTGIRKDATLSGLQAAGWRKCFEGAYADSSDIAALLAGCTGRYMLLGCRASDTTDALALAAADLRTVVTQPDATGAVHVVNGVGWYFNDSWSWGFFPAGDAATLDPCDSSQTSKDQRMCWHAVEGVLTPGYRCGDNQLNTDATWRRLVMVHP
jgi:hypothetical protein